MESRKYKHTHQRINAGNTMDYKQNYADANTASSVKKIDEIKLKIEECNYVKYSTYRVALKLHVLQDIFHMRMVPLSMIEGVFERHKLQINESSLCLESSELEAVLYDIYFAAAKQSSSTHFDVDDATDQMVDLLSHIFEKEVNIQVSTVKLVLALLSSCTLNQLYSFLFKLCSDHNNCMTRLRLQTILTKLTEIMVFLEEDVIFGQHLVNSSVEDCFANSPGLVGINEATFILWLNKQPHFLSWLPILDRIKSSHTVVHSLKCSSCKNTPVRGLVYKCLKCVKYVQCQYCFFIGRISHSHKLSHCMREYASQKNPQDNSYDILKKLLRLIGCSFKSDNQAISAAKMYSLRNSYKHCFAKCLAPEFCDIGHLPFNHQLRIIIGQLEQQNRYLQMMAMRGSECDKEMQKYLDNHMQQMALQVRRLRVLSNNLKLNGRCVDCTQDCISSKESTPKTANSYEKNGHIDLDILSPILRPYKQDSDRYVTCNASFDGETKLMNCDASSPDVSRPYTYNDISTWIGGQPLLSSDNSNVTVSQQQLLQKSQMNSLQTDLDDALAKLQQILANNFSMEESTSIDNGKLKYAVSEVEGVLTSFIDTVESTATSTVYPKNST